MSLPVRSLTVIQNWDCHACGGCCHEYLVRVTDPERRRIEAQGWERRPETAGKTLIRKQGWLRPTYWLAHKPDGSCVFLNETGGCRIHAEFGPEGKPLACRVYPFMLVPAGDHWRVGLRYACPSAANGKGRPLSEHATDVRLYAAGIEEREGVDPASLPPPAMPKRQGLTWDDALAVTRTLLKIVGDTGRSLETRLRRALAFASLCRQATFEKLSGGKFRDFLGVVREGTAAEVPDDPAGVPPPTWVGRILFRQFASIYARKDRGEHAGVSRRGRLALFGAALRFARGRGAVPRVHGLMPETTFAEVEDRRVPLSPGMDRRLTDYYLVKLESMQFCGPTNFGLTYWDGLESLIVTFPVMRWLTRVMHDRPADEAAILALRMVDDHFGFNALFGTTRQRVALRALASRGETARLVAWYG